MAANMTPSKTHTCESCYASFPNQTSLRRHRFNRHTLPPPFRKDGKVYQAVHNGGRLECPFDDCSKAYINRDDFQAHLRKVHSAEFEAPGDMPGPDAGGPGPRAPSGNRTGAKATDPILAIPASDLAHEGQGVARSEGIWGISAASHAVCGDTQTGQLVPMVPDKVQVAGASSAEAIDGSTRSGIELVPEVDYLFRTGILDRLGLFLHRKLLVLICRECKVALTSMMVAGHLLGTHGQKMGGNEKEELQKVCSQQSIYARPEEVPVPNAGGPPVQGIAQPIPGLTCSAAADCHYSVRDLQAMLKHGREKHGKGLTTNALYRPSTIQVLFRGVGRVYFEVDATLTSFSDVAVRTYLKQTFLPITSADEVITQRSDRDRPPLLKITLWDLFLPEVREDSVQRKHARGVKEGHTAHEHGGIFVSLEKVVKLHHELAKKQLDHHCQRFTLAKVLLSGAKFSPSQSAYFKPLPSENHAYIALFVQMARAMIRKESGHGLSLNFSLTDKQRSSLEGLVGSLETSTAEDSERALLRAVTAYQAFCWSLISAIEPGSQTDWRNPVQRFIWLMALRDDGSFIQASDLTPLLAKLKYFCRLTVLYECIVCSEQEDAVARMGRLYDEVLSLGMSTTFNLIWELQQFASSLAYGQLKDPDVFVDPGYAWISIHGKVLYLERLRRGMQGLLREAKDSFIALSSSAAWPTPHAEFITENLGNVQRGYCFLEEGPFCQRKHDFFLSAVEKHSLGALTAEGAWAWNELAIRKFLDRAEEIWSHFIHALYVGLQLSTRVTQFLQLQIRNADRPRNFVFQGKECMVISRYSKTTNARGKDGCTPAFLAPALTEILLVLLGSGLREAQALLAGVVYGSEARWFYRTYLVVQHGERVKPDNFYEWLRKRNQQWFDCGWGASEFRQGMITLGHEFISPDETFPCADDLLAESADHSTEVDASHYAVLHGTLPRLSNNTMSRHRWLSEEWSSLLGLGPQQPPEPVRVIRTRARSKSLLDPNELALRVADLVGNALISKLGAMGVIPGFIANVSQHQHMQTLSACSGPGNEACSALEPQPNVVNGAPPPSVPALAATQPLASAAYLSPDHSGSSVEAFQVMSAPRTSQPLTLHHPCGRQPPATVYTEEPTRPKEGTFHCTSRSVTVEEWRSEPLGACRGLASAKGLRAIGQDDADEESASQSFAQFEEDSAEILPTGRLPPAIADGMENNAAPSTSDRDPPGDVLVTRNVLQVPLAESALLRENIRGAMQALVGDPATKEKSEAQMLGILIVMRGRQDAMVTMRTGGGKSMLWQVPVLLNTELRFVVVCPFTVLLEEQCERAKKANIKAVDYGQSRAIPPDVQILFAQVEHFSSQAFMKMMLSPDTPKFTHIFIDEHHDQLDCPTDRRKAWKMLAERASLMEMPIILLSGSVPPDLEKPLMKAYGLSQTETAFVRSSTNRPEIGLHTIYLDPSASTSALAHLVYALHSRLKADERMLVLFASCEEAEEFAGKARCAVFHRGLPSTGNTKAYNLGLWDRGETKLMACTSAFATGVDRQKIRFIVVYKPTYSLLMVMQMAGRAGRDGSESHVFFATSQKAGPKFKQDDDYSLVYELGKVVHQKKCKILQATLYLDGERMARACSELRGQVPCDICDPSSEIHEFAVHAVQNPRQTVPRLYRAGNVEPLPAPCKSVEQAYATAAGKGGGKASSFKL
ncbi:hypothetical protein L210DRAFT_986547 [Boletus edulis BED1]|uniref:DNA 3'-5' helicase n=1 Tax=Boletus edulis BED1 TaxID=1328754 RepID=A0AAD4G826_BOLED|nr:hypothetical protein L210DRAFT_986547 [Boletus edulis BED1]